MFDLKAFTLRDMTELGGTMRRLGDGARTMEEVANRVVRELYEHLIDLDTGERSCAMVRFFKTHPYGELDERLRKVAQGLLHGEMPSPGMRCLTLLATAGDKSEWNSPRESVAHKVIPLLSADMLRRAPMISSLLQQLGVEVDVLLHPDSGLLVESGQSSFNVFYVPDAVESPYIPAQEGFVKPLGICSVLGFGGMLPSGDIFAVILFSKVLIPRETARLFRTLALNVKVAALPFKEAVFQSAYGFNKTPIDDRNDTPIDDRNDIKTAGLFARISTLEQLLDVYERSVIEQSDKLYAEQERMRFQKTLLESQGEASLEGILSIGLDGTVLFANQRFSALWGVDLPTIGFTAYEALFRSLSERTAYPAEFLEQWALLDSAEESRQEVVLRDGRTLDQYTVPIRSQDGSHFGRVWHFRDVTAFKEMSRTKDELVSAVSHELRTPLTSVWGSLDLMASGVLGELPGEAMSLLKVAQNNCARLVRLINDVLDIAKIEAGRMDFHLEVVELAPLVEQSVKTTRPYGVQLGVRFQIEGAAPGVWVRVDPDRLIQVMENLLSNAARFSPSGGEVRVALADRDRYVRVSVTDRGPGIAPEFRSHLFEQFTQAARPSSRQKGGTGLGLSIARAIVERIGGSIGFVSRAGEGTTFHFDLPKWGAGRDGNAAPRPP